MVSIQQQWAAVAASGADSRPGQPSAFREYEESPVTEAALLREARVGDHAALERLVALHQRSLFALCFGMLGHAEDAEDAVQEAFLQALRGLPGFRGEAAFRTWLHRIAVNLCLRWRSRRLPTDPWDEQRPDAPTDTDSPERIAVRRLRVREALGALRPRQRAVLLLKELEGWSMAEIGAALGWNEKRVENELYRARRALVEWRRQESDGGDER
jgi:RNA polymerase sigma-70 factor (ECF subfamily)